MESFFQDRALLDSRYYNGSVKSLLNHYIPVEISNDLSNTLSEIRHACNDNSTDLTVRCFSTKSNDEIKLIFYAPCGFEQVNVRNCKPFNCYADTDPRATVSLALINPKSKYLEDYANKLPLMTINVRRFKYTVKALQYASNRIDLSSLFCEYMDDNLNEDLVTLALNIMIRSDLMSLNIQDPPNLRFSNFLHRLKCTGSLEFIFNIAKNLKFHIDLIYIDSCVKSLCKERETLYSYKLDNTLRGNAIGTLTVVYVKRQNAESEWFVYVHPKSLLKCE